MKREKRNRKTSSFEIFSLRTILYKIKGSIPKAKTVVIKPTLEAMEKNPLKEKTLIGWSSATEMFTRRGAVGAVKEAFIVK